MCIAFAKFNYGTTLFLFVPFQQTSPTDHYRIFKLAIACLVMITICKILKLQIIQHIAEL